MSPRPDPRPISAWRAPEPPRSARILLYQRYYAVVAGFFNDRVRGTPIDPHIHRLASPRCFAMKPNITTGPWRSRPRPLLKFPARPSAAWPPVSCAGPHPRPAPAAFCREPPYRVDRDIAEPSGEVPPAVDRDLSPPGRNSRPRSTTKCTASYLSAPLNCLFVSLDLRFQKHPNLVSLKTGSSSSCMCWQSRSQ